MFREKDISVIIPTYNEEGCILECLESLQNQSYQNFEIIVVDDGSTDKTKEIVKKLQEKDKRIKLIKGEHKGPGFSRNLGAKKAKGKILVFVDADMTFDKDYIKNLIKPILEDKSGKIIGTTHDYEIANNLESIWSKCWGKVRIERKDANNIKIFRAIRKDKFLELGGFDPKYGYADDQTFWIKYRIFPIVAKNTTCYHKNPKTLKEVYKQSRWIGASLNNILTRVTIIKYLSPFVMLLAFPFAIPILSIKKCFKIKNFKILFPWMLIFMAVRYFGTIEGIFNKVYKGKNFR